MRVNVIFAKKLTPFQKQIALIVQIWYTVILIQDAWQKCHMTVLPDRLVIILAWRTSQESDHGVDYAQNAVMKKNGRGVMFAKEMMDTER